MPRLRLRARPPFPFALLLSLAAGFLLSLAFPPAGLWPLAFVALVPLFWLLRDERPFRGFLLGLIFGIAFYGATLYWILRFGLMAWTALTLLMGLWTALFGLVAPAIRRAGRPVLTALGWAALWTVIDWGRGAWPLGGFTWGSLGVSQVNDHVTVRVATVAGVWGVTFIVAAVNALIVGAADGGVRGRRRLVAVGVGALLILAPLGIAFSVPDGRSVDVATVQVDVRRAAAGASGTEDIAVAALNVREAAKLEGGDPPDLVVWGEGALDPAAAADPTVMSAVRGTIAAVGSPTLVGAVTHDAHGRERTAVLLFDAKGDLAGRYDKVHLVPFGEYVPFRDELSWIKALEQVPVDRTPGERIHTLTTGGLPAFGTPICFENSFPSIPRAFVNAGAGFLIVTVNNASYGFTAASDQHLQMSQMRAVETGRWIVDGAVSGVSAFVDPSGRVVARDELFRPGILRDTIRSSDERTWYVRLGDWLPWLALLFVAVLIVRPRRRPSSRGAPEALAAAPRTLVILPTYDEAATIDRVLDGVLEAPEHVDVLVIDDSSPDGTGRLVAQRAAGQPRIRAIERPAKAGLATAYLEGFRLALDEGYDLVVEMDSDLSHDPAELPGLIEDAASRRDLTLGSRYVPGGTVTNWSRSRVLLSRAGNAYASFMLGLPVRDATSGYRVYRRRLLHEMMAKGVTSEGYGFQIELVMRACDLGFTVGEQPITFREREHGHSKISRRIVAEALWSVTKWGVAGRLRPSPALGADPP